MTGSGLTGKLLVATPALHDPNFSRTVVLVCHHDDDGAFGVVLNRASDIAVAEHLPRWSGDLADPPTVFVGGPVQPETGIGLGSIPGGSTAPGWTPVADALGLVDLATSPEDFAPLAALRVFSGYSGWGVGQVEGEIERGDWFVVAAGPDDVFTAHPDGLWRDVLRRQRGHVAIFADFPPDPRLN